MDNTVLIGEFLAIIGACWAIISGIGAWKREFIGKRKIELAEEVLASFFEVKDAIAAIRNPFSSGDEGKSRQRGDHETEDDAELLDRGYIVFERYERRKDVFVKFHTLKYRFMASFGHDTKDIFEECDRVLNSIFISARRLATYYWHRQGRVPMKDDEFEKHLEEMRKHEGVFWDSLEEEDEIRKKLQVVQDKLDSITKPCFEEPMTTYSLFTRKLFKKS